jgi:8-oxo-dGTP pyrophosphatase MutT (NUDIX family)
MHGRPLVATDATDSLAYPLDFLTVHKQGIPHRVIHVEVVNPAEKYLVWKRDDGRLEIPGGHVDWLEAENRPESYEEAALRELSEELNLQRNWELTFCDTLTRLQGRLVPITRVINQTPSSQGNNNEWVAVYRLNWQDEWGDPCTFKDFGDGSTSPRWLLLNEIAEFSLNNPMAINAALRLFLQRRNILCPRGGEF